MRPWLVFLLLSATLAGCTTTDAPETTMADVPVLDEASAKIYGILGAVEEWVTMDDGQRMHNAVFRPDTDEPVPVFINFSPYWGDTAEQGGDAFSQYMINEYVPRGYAVVLSALRGTGHSEGCFQIGGDREVQDMHDVVDHYANLEWSNGNIATGGKSYDSSPTNGLIAKMPHPALKGVFHVSGITDMYAYNYKGGVPYTTGAIFNTYYYAQGTDEYGVSLVGAGSADDEDAESLARIIDDVACTELPLIQAHGIGSAVTGLKSDYWVERDWTRYIGDSEWNGSIFFVHGLQDWNVKPDHILPWIEELPEQIRVKGWLHQGGHVYPERADWNHTMLAWMDHELKGHNNQFWDGSAWSIESDNGVYFDEASWPPAGEMVLGFNSDELPAGGWAYEFNGSYRVSGSAEVVGGYRLANPDAVWTATFWAESGGQRTWLSEAILRSVYRDGLEMPATPEPLDAFSGVLKSHPFDHEFAAGDQLVVTFQEAPVYGIVTPAQLAQDGMAAGSLVLPISHATPAEMQPAAMECFAC